ncbi:MAG: hypothetical protein JW981_01715 [Anaerolineae bacterium]|nr:hypothetical protein [Anaerolineae bacterium]
MKKQGIGSLLAILILVSIVSGCGSTASTTTDSAATTAPVPELTAASMTATPSAPDVSLDTDGTAVDSGTLTTVLRDDYTDALSARNQLALGSLRLEGSADAITVEQAQELKLYWQALLALTTDSTAASEETTALQNQIMDEMMAAQLEAIAAMQLTNADLNEFYVEQGIELTTPEPGVTPQAGKNSGLSQADREATRTASAALGTPSSRGSGSGASRRDVLLNVLISLLTERAGS